MSLAPTLRRQTTVLVPAQRQGPNEGEVGLRRQLADSGRRGWLRQALMLALGVLAVFTLMRSSGGVTNSFSGLQAADVEALVLAAGLCALSYLFAAVAQRGAVALPLPFGPLVAVQVACAFTNRLLPGGLGTLATNGRFLRRNGLTPAGAATAVSLNSITGFAIHVVALAVAVPVLLSYPGKPFQLALPGLSSGQVLLVAVAVVVAVVAGAAAVRVLPRASGLLRRALSAVRDGAAVLRSPRKTCELLLGSCGVTVLHAVAFTVCVQAVGGTVKWTDLVAVYVVGAALAAAAPTPGGLGALEAALVFGLVSLGMATPLAVAGVLWFRLLSFWFPTVPGIAAFGFLLRSRRL
ncbi:MAG: hypothetical protein JWP14_575 [Frankiales bacterium]|nr:hypothetical protein [Frankiales bacterium]